MPRPCRFTPRKDPVPIMWETGWAPWTVWTGAENLATTGTGSPDRPARNESLYRLSYPGTYVTDNMNVIFDIRYRPRILKRISY